MAQRGRLRLRAVTLARPQAHRTERWWLPAAGRRACPRSGALSPDRSVRHWSLQKEAVRPVFPSCPAEGVSQQGADQPACRHSGTALLSHSELHLSLSPAVAPPACRGWRAAALARQPAVRAEHCEGLQAADRLASRLEAVPVRTPVGRAGHYELPRAADLVPRVEVRAADLREMRLAGARPLPGEARERWPAEGVGARG